MSIQMPRPVPADIVTSLSIGARSFTERAVRYGGDGAVAGIITEAARPVANAPAMVFITAGMVHRVGPNRMHVMLGRELARDGFSSTRFDVAGIGDSQPRTDGTPADESAVLETMQVMTAMGAVTGARTFVLAGLCSGAVTAFRTALRDERVAGIVLLNPQGFDHDQAWNAHVLNLTDARRYVTRAATSSSNWRRALTGRIDYRRAVRVLMRRAFGAATARAARLPVAERLHGEFEALERRGVATLAICCHGDSSVDYMTQILATDVGQGHRSGRREVRVFDRTDHSFTLLTSQHRLRGAIREWLISAPWASR